ncbi:hypothetical protein [Kocuria flava]|uniref:Uncharacterized protein n=1 Tax=Kocuria flava TaxID=446860 RepID=A0ABQ0XFE2_9MICC|nr:hypothetical protein [Kocuria flava]GEO93565.1 hypothetical protein KFL01_28710 [Kocuria flava]
MPNPPHPGPDVHPAYWPALAYAGADEAKTHARAVRWALHAGDPDQAIEAAEAATAAAEKSRYGAEQTARYAPAKEAEARAHAEEAEATARAARRQARTVR